MQVIFEKSNLVKTPTQVHVPRSSFSRLRPEKESHREFDTNIMSTQRTCYTHKIYTPYSQTHIALKTQHLVKTPTQVHVFRSSFSHLGPDKESYREFYINIMSTQHTCYTQKIHTLYTTIHFAFNTQTSPCAFLVLQTTNTKQALMITLVRTLKTKVAPITFAYTCQ